MQYAPEVINEDDYLGESDGDDDKHMQENSSK